MTSLCERRSLYRLYDPDPGKGCFLVTDHAEAEKFSNDHWGIFWTVNEFEGPRKKENCKKVLSWIVDLDSGTKEEMAGKIRDSKVLPSAVIETKRGFHVYFDSIDGELENFVDIEERLIDAYGGDKNAKDLCRILRVPGYCHWKDLNDPFPIKQVFESDSRYTEDEIRKLFPRPVEQEKQIVNKTQLRENLKFQADSDLWERVWSLNCVDALKRISGSAAVNYEMYSFRENSNGNLNILVNGKSTSCWIDSQKRIGSLDKGGPTIFNWLLWFNKDTKRAYAILKEYFPEVVNGK